MFNSQISPLNHPSLFTKYIDMRSGNEEWLALSNKVLPVTNAFHGTASTQTQANWSLTKIVVGWMNLLADAKKKKVGYMLAFLDKPQRTGLTSLSLIL